jgi:hypothetical protein
MTSILRSSGLILALLCCLVSQSPGAEPADGNPRTVYFTTGDAQDLLEFPPLDSRTAIATAFATLQEQWQVERIWWRGGQDEVWGRKFVIRPENRYFARIWDWWRDLQYRQVGTNRIAVEEAHRRKMKIWLTYGLFDNGSQADAGYSGFPYAVEDKLRVAHPEWAPVNRWGTWRQGGPLEFAYPAARQAMADYLNRYVVEGNYDGIAFLTYAENFSQRYDDEFGYSPPIVEEFQAKYGQDIRREDFDREAWRRLRGGHVTEFLRLLKTQLSAQGKQVAVCVDGKEPERPTLWNVNGGVRTAGNLKWLLDEWLQGNVVDEICLYPNATAESIATVLNRSRELKSPVRISVFRSRGELPVKVPRVMFLGREIESGYIGEAWVDYPDEQLAEEPRASLDSNDVHARRRVLTLALKGKLTLTAEQYAKAIADPDIYVRRTALRAIARHKVPGTSAAVQGALRDSENTVRCLAALALAELPEDDAVPLLLAAAFQPDSTFQFHDRAVPDALKKRLADGRLGAPEKQRLVKHLADDNSRTRELVLYYFTLIGAPATPDVEKALTQIALHDRNAYSRELAFVNLRSSFGPTASVVKTLLTVMDEEGDHAVQVRAATAFAGMHARLEPTDRGRDEALGKALDFFRRYGDGCQRTDREWGWRLLGNTLLEFGPAGEKGLKALMAASDDRTLSDRAWRILYLKQGDQFYPLTAAEDAEAHRQHPWLNR